MLRSSTLRGYISLSLGGSLRLLGRMGTSVLSSSPPLLLSSSRLPVYQLLITDVNDRRNIDIRELSAHVPPHLRNETSYAVERELKDRLKRFEKMLSTGIPADPDGGDGTFSFSIPHFFLPSPFLVPLTSPPLPPLTMCSVSRRRHIPPPLHIHPHTPTLPILHTPLPHERVRTRDRNPHWCEGCRA